MIVIIHLEHKTMETKIIGAGEFGLIYEGVKGKDAIDFLIFKKEGEVKNALVDLEFNNKLKTWVVTSYIPL